MRKILRLQHQQMLEQRSATEAKCEILKRKHENLARAYRKIIGSLERDKLMLQPKR